MNVASHRTAVSHMNVQQFEVNVFGAVAVIQAMLPTMRGRRRGNIINITRWPATSVCPASRYHRPMDMSPAFRLTRNV
jgi:NAD(P)-dependent dehydrogenase (short-subunit alcohol dehydrogenase family)